KSIFVRGATSRIRLAASIIQFWQADVKQDQVRIQLAVGPRPTHPRLRRQPAAPALFEEHSKHTASKCQNHPPQRCEQGKRCPLRDSSHSSYFLGEKPRRIGIDDSAWFLPEATGH